VAFFMRNGADCLSKWVGEAERSLRATFAAAEAHSPAIIFFDEIDGLAPVRSSRQDQIHASIVSTLLGLMDGLEGRGQIVVIGATNRVDAIDPALRRPGRFDRELVFNLPNMAARRSILGIHTRAWTPPPAAPLLDAVAARAVGYCGADLRALCAEAALRALRRRYPQIYDSSAKLAIDAGSLTVRDRDFAAAMKALVPASHRAARTYARPLPSRLATLLARPLEEAVAVLRRIFPQGLASGVLSAGPAGPEVEGVNAIALGGGEGIGRASSALVVAPASQGADGGGNESARHGDNGHATSGSESTSDDDADGGYWESDSDSGGGGGGDEDVVAAIVGAPGLNVLERATLHPRLLVCGSPGLGQAELGPALLHALEGCPVHAIDLPSLLADPGTQGGDEALASAVREACRAAPAILYIPHMELWWDSSPGILEASLQFALRDIPTTLPLLVLGTCDVPLEQVPLEYMRIFADKITLESPDEELRAAHFEPLLAAAAAVPRSAARRSGEGVDGRRRARPPPPPLPLAVEAPPPPALSAAASAAAAAAAVESRRRDDEAVLRVLRMEMRALLERLLSDKKLKPYWRPVDPAVAPDYYEIIKRPVDLSLIAANVDRGRYPTVLAMIADFDQMVRNALKYNPPHTEEGAVLIRRANAIVDVVHAWADGLTPALVERCNAIVAARVAAASAAAAAALEVASPSAAAVAECGGGTTPAGATNDNGSVAEADGAAAVAPMAAAHTVNASADAPASAAATPNGPTAMDVDPPTVSAAAGVGGPGVDPTPSPPRTAADGDACEGEATAPARLESPRARDGDAAAAASNRGGADNNASVDQVGNAELPPLPPAPACVPADPAAVADLRARLLVATNDFSVDGLEAAHVQLAATLRRRRHQRHRAAVVARLAEVVEKIVVEHAAAPPPPAPKAPGGSQPAVVG